MPERNELTSEAFVAKVKELQASDVHWGIMYDIDYDQIKIIEAVDGQAVAFYSPVLCRMPDSEHIPFRAELETLIPVSDPTKGLYW